MKRVLYALPVLLLLAACRDSETPATTTNTEAAPASTAGTPAAAAPTGAPAPTVAATPPAVDTGAMSGAFGIGATRLELHGEGTYGLDEDGKVTSGTWTPVGTDKIHLDPGTKDAHDRIYRRDGNDALVLVDAGGEAAAGTRLKRLPIP